MHVSLTAVLPAGGHTDGGAVVPAGHAEAGHLPHAGHCGQGGAALCSQTVQRSVQHFSDNWVVSLHLGQLVWLPEAWENYKAARAAITGVASQAAGKAGAARQAQQLHSLTPRLAALLSEGAVTQAGPASMQPQFVPRHNIASVKLSDEMSKLFRFTPRDAAAIKLFKSVALFVTNQRRKLIFVVKLCVQDSLLEGSGKVVAAVRESNVCLRWLYLHTAALPPSVQQHKRTRQLAETVSNTSHDCLNLVTCQVRAAAGVGQADLLQLLILTARLELLTR